MRKSILAMILAMILVAGCNGTLKASSDVLNTDTVSEKAPVKTTEAEEDIVAEKSTGAVIKVKHIKNLPFR
ncbi:MAG TPA: hypothetical protein VEG39_00590 [Clostridia bacterium]|nr:hypothetical protein [Clostridia bacterium]